MRDDFTEQFGEWGGGATVKQPATEPIRDDFTEQFGEWGGGEITPAPAIEEVLPEREAPVTLPGEGFDFQGQADSPLASLPQLTPLDGPQISKKYPGLQRFAKDNEIEVRTGSGEGFAEVYKKGEGDSPDPTKSIIVVRDTGDFDPDDVASADLLHFVGDKENGDPKFRKLKERFIDAMTDKQKARNRNKYAEFKNKGQTGTNFESYENYLEAVGSDELIRAGLFPHLMSTEEERDKFASEKPFSDKQRQILRQMRSYMKGEGPDAITQEVDGPAADTIFTETRKQLSKWVDELPGVFKPSKIAIGTLETMAEFVSGFAASVPAGLAGIYTLAVNKGDYKKAEEVVGMVHDAFTAEVQTKYGKDIKGLADIPFKAYTDFTPNYSRTLPPP